MRLMGIDFGTKRVGVASTDESGGFALPRSVLENSEKLVDEVVSLAREWKVERVIVGESKNFKGFDNPVMAEVKEFVEGLRGAGLEVALHPEVLTSAEAEQLQGKNEMLDASAAAIILKSYIDSHD